MFKPEENELSCPSHLFKPKKKKKRRKGPRNTPDLIQLCVVNHQLSITVKYSKLHTDFPCIHSYSRFPYQQLEKYNLI